MEENGQKSLANMGFTSTPRQKDNNKRELDTNSKSEQPMKKSKVDGKDAAQVRLLCYFSESLKSEVENNRGEEEQRKVSVKLAKDSSMAGSQREGEQNLLHCLPAVSQIQQVRYWLSKRASVHHHRPRE